LAVAAASANVVRYDGYHVYAIGPLKSDDEMHLVRGLIDHDERLRKVILFDDDLSKKIAVDIAVAPDTVHRFLETLSQHSIRYMLVDIDLQKTFDRTMEENERALQENAKTGEIFPHNAYLSYPAQQQFLNDLAAANSIARVFSLGTSYEGRVISGLSINDGNIGLPAIYIDAGIHPREWIAQATALYIVDKILTDSSADAVYLRNNFRWYFIPNLNPDGYEHTRSNDRLWRKTRSPNAGSLCVGTDANRNWDSNWGGPGASANPCDETYRGASAFSEVETQAARNFLIQLRPTCNLMISIHAYSQLWLMPWGGYAVHPVDYDELFRVGSLAADAIFAVNGKRFEVGTPPDILYVAAGGSFDWAKESNDIKYAYSPELRPATSIEGGFDIPPSNIIPSGEEIFAAFVVTAREVTHKI
jgi:carboxypeptidase A2